MSDVKGSSLYQDKSVYLSIRAKGLISLSGQKGSFLYQYKGKGSSLYQDKRVHFSIRTKGLISLSGQKGSFLYQYKRVHLYQYKSAHLSIRTKGLISLSEQKGSSLYQDKRVHFSIRTKGLIFLSEQKGSSLRTKWDIALSGQMGILSRVISEHINISQQKRPSQCPKQGDHIYVKGTIALIV